MSASINKLLSFFRSEKSIPVEKPAADQFVMKLDEGAISLSINQKCYRLAVVIGNSLENTAEYFEFEEGYVEFKTILNVPGYRFSDSISSVSTQPRVINTKINYNTPFFELENELVPETNMIQIATKEQCAHLAKVMKQGIDGIDSSEGFLALVKQAMQELYTEDSETAECDKVQKRLALKQSSFYSSSEFKLGITDLFSSSSSGRVSSRGYSKLEPGCDLSGGKVIIMHFMGIPNDTLIAIESLDPFHKLLVYAVESGQILRLTYKLASTSVLEHGTNTDASPYIQRCTEYQHPDYPDTFTRRIVIADNICCSKLIEYLDNFMQIFNTSMGTGNTQELCPESAFQHVFSLVLDNMEMRMESKSECSLM